MNKTNKSTILHLAVGDEAASEKLVKALIEEGAGVNLEDEYWNTPLHLAAMHGKVELVRLLLAHNADCKAPNIAGESPLHAAVRSKELEIVELILEKDKTSINCKDHFGHTLLDLAENKPMEIPDNLPRFSRFSTWTDGEGTPRAHRCATMHQTEAPPAAVAGGA